MVAAVAAWTVDWAKAEGTGVDGVPSSGSAWNKVLLSSTMPMGCNKLPPELQATVTIRSNSIASNSDIGINETCKSAR